MVKYTPILLSGYWMGFFFCPTKYDNNMEVAYPAKPPHSSILT